MVISALEKPISRALFKSVRIAPLIVFRIIFGALLLYGSVRFVAKGWVNTLYIEPHHFFGYYGFEWVKPLPGTWMYLPFILMIFSALCIIIGFKYRWAAALFFISFTYVELLDKSNYLNHYYFVSLMAFLMIWLPANRQFSIDVFLRPSLRWKRTPAWTINILKFQLAVVYCFAGIAKLNSDWLLEALPLKIWLQAHHNIPLVGELLAQPWTAYLFSWFGCFYDLFIVFFLLSSKTRPWAYVVVVIFHVITWLLFPIGIFPWVMIFSTLIFFSARFHQQLLLILRSIFSRITQRSFPFNPPVKRLSPWKRKLTVVLITSYVLFQVLVPFRHLLYPGNLFWNEEGFRFSWRVMLMHKEGHATFYIEDQSSGRMSEIDNSKFLTETQEDQMATQPDMILQFADILYEEYKGKTLEYNGTSFTLEDPAVRAEIYVSLNARPSQLFVSKEHDLSEYNYNLNHRSWLEPFTP
jgi:hypothetical protein